MQQFWFFVLAINALILLVSAQGPFPPRLSIPGAIAVSGPPVSRSPFRNDKQVRVRRPISQRAHNVIVPTLPPRIIEETKPVTEAPEEEDNIPDVFLPSLLREQQLAQAQQAQFQQQAAAFLNNDHNAIIDSPPTLQLLNQDEPVLLPTLPRFSERPQPVAQTNSRPAFNDYGIGAGISASRFERPQPTERQREIPAPTSAPVPQQVPQRVNIIRSRPVPAREHRPQYEPQIAAAPRYETPAPAPAPRPRPRPIQPRPTVDQNQLHDVQDRRQKVVAQTIRKWREENEDGSITWGYENDDGSFKEEIIGTDCVTKGTYGYIDPDGNKREYHYETGIKCDPNTRETEEELQENGFINYEENKAILPNGIEIDMSQLGKRKSKRPGAQLRN